MFKYNFIYGVLSVSGNLLFNSAKLDLRGP